jgi:hypothetical protein
MTAFRIAPFGGLVPRTGTHLLPDSAATVANNVKVQSGELRPLRQPALVSAPDKEMPAQSIFRAWNGEDSGWMTWTADVDVVRVPISADVESRFVWTGDGIPKMAPYSDAVSGGGNDYPKVFYSLGIPAPLAAPTVTPDATGSGAATTRIYTYTFFSALGEESAPAPVSGLITGKVDDVWNITGMDDLPPNTGDITNITYVGKSVTITTTNTHFNRAGEKITIEDVSTVTNVNGTWTLTATNPAAKTMTFTVTDNPAGVYNNATDTTDSWTREADFNTTGMKRRLYRSTGTTGTVQLVDDDVGTSFADSVTDANLLGDELISGDWAQPPTGLRGVKVHSSGALVGFVGNLLCFSVPYQPHAWPVAYQRATDRDIVGIDTFGSEVGVGTKGRPWIASGTDPESVSFDKVPGLYPCLSKRSLVGYGDGLIYSSRQGLVYAGQSGVDILTKNFYTEDEWDALAPENMMCAVAYGRIYIAFTRRDGSKSTLILDGDLLVTADLPVFAIYADESTSELFICDADGIKAWDDADSYPLSASWRSKDFMTAKPLNFGAAKIDFDVAIDPATREAILAAIAAAEEYNATLLLTGNVHGAINAVGFNSIPINGSAMRQVPDVPPSNQLTFILRRDGDDIVISRTVTSKEAFRLPAGYLADVFSVEVFSQCNIREIRIGETMRDLQSV